MRHHRFKMLVAVVLAAAAFYINIPEARAADVEAIGVPLTVGPNQSGFLEHDFGLLNHIELDWPQGTLDEQATIKAEFMTSASAGISNRLPKGATLAPDSIFRLTAADRSGIRITDNLKKDVTIRLFLPLPGDLANTSAYYLDETANRWIRIPDAAMDSAAGRATLTVDHLGTFAIFRAAGSPASLSAQSNPAPASNGTEAAMAAFIAYEKAQLRNRNQALVDRLVGRILLQVEQRGEAWYVDPRDDKRYFLDGPARALEMMGKMAIGVSNATWSAFTNVAPANLAGRFLLKVEDSGRLYYVHPLDRSFRYISSPLDAWMLMSNTGLGITDVNLRQITVGDMK